MHKPEKRITEFIRQHHVLTLSTCAFGKSWSANCFYAYMEDENMLVFTSDENTKHIQDVKINPEVSGSIFLETKIVGKIQGIQFTGIMSEPEGDLFRRARHYYLKKFPFAALMNTTLWVLKINYIKMTDNRLGFGKKLIWES
jgi:uncharacterized protein YhbP (UPF0306 family)